GRRLRQHYSEDRRTGRVVHAEAAPGVVIVIAAWMLDPIACRSMELGSPRVSISALVELNDLLVRRGLRRSSPCDPTVAEEKHHDRAKGVGANGAAPPIGDDVRCDAVARYELRRTPSCDHDARDPADRGGDARN